MAIFSHYGTGQRVGFVTVCVGFAFCFIGSIAPYWIKAETDSSLGSVGLHLGVWYYCVDYILGEECSSFYDSSSGGHDDDRHEFDWINVVRACVVFNILLSLLSGVISCCRCMCCAGGRTICHGVLSFCSGGLGVIAVAIFYNKTKSLLNLRLEEVDYAWAFGLYSLGTALLVVASFVLCCAMPREMNYGMVMAPSAVGGINVNVSNSNTNSNVNDVYNAGAPIRSFEPLPNVAMPPPPPHQHYGMQPEGNYPPAYNYPK